MLVAQRRMLVALAAGGGRGRLRAAVRPPAGEVVALDTELGGTAATLYRPGRRPPPWPTVVILPGVTERGRRHPALVGVGRGLGCAGLQAAVVEPAGLAIGELTPASADAVGRAVEELAGCGDVCDGRIALAGASGGATLALAVAGSGDVAARVSAVAALAPCCDLRAALLLATTDCYPRDGRLAPFHPGAFLRLVLARSAVAWLPDSPDRRALRQHVLGLADDSANPLRHVRSWPTAGLGREARALVELLGNEDPARFDRLYESLSDTQRAAVARLSPIAVARSLEAPVELVVARDDKYLPLDDALAFARACPSARLTVIDSLEHAVPRVSGAGLRDLARLDAAAVRFLAAACAPSYSRA